MLLLFAFVWFCNKSNIKTVHVASTGPHWCHRTKAMQLPHICLHHSWIQWPLWSNCESSHHFCAICLQVLMKNMTSSILRKLSPLRWWMFSPVWVEFQTGFSFRCVVQTLFQLHMGCNQLEWFQLANVQVVLWFGGSRTSRCLWRFKCTEPWSTGSLLGNCLKQQHDEVIQRLS